ncbi:MAG: signal peptidase I [Myxococcales bacterium]|nr:signal peptidase I [Myxococcales bacterium]
MPSLVALSRRFWLAALPESGFTETLRGQPIPVAIVLFTVAAMVLWGQRYTLPGAAAAGVGGRSGLPASIRKSFDRRAPSSKRPRAIRRAHGRRSGASCARSTATSSAALTGAHPRDGRRHLRRARVPRRLREGRGGRRRASRRFRKSEAREYAESIFVAVMVALGIRAFVIEAFKIPSGSMIPTLLMGDHIFVNKLAYGPLLPFTKKRLWNAMPPGRGDVIVFLFPENPEEDFIKRVIALPGDKLEVKDGRVWLNDKPIPRCLVGRTNYAEVPEVGGPLGGGPITQEGDLYVEYLDNQAYLTFYTLSSLIRTNAGPWYPKQGEVWVLGDNRNNSRDSREWWGQKGGGVPFENIRGRALWIWLSYTGGEGNKAERIGSTVMGRPRLPASMKALQPALDKCLAPNPPLEALGTLPPG